MNWRGPTVEYSSDPAKGSLFGIFYDELRLLPALLT